MCRVPAALKEADGGTYTAALRRQAAPQIMPKKGGKLRRCLLRKSSSDGM